MSEPRMPLGSQPSAHEALIIQSERAFDMSLIGLAKGLDAVGQHFQEQVTLQSISAQTAAFSTFINLIIGSRVTLTLDIPRTLMLEKPLTLVISGSVCRIDQQNGSAGFKRVKLLLDRGFRLRQAA